MSGNNFGPQEPPQDPRIFNRKVNGAYRPLAGFFNALPPIGGMVCHWCKQPLTFDPQRGWVHPEGGLYVMYCKACGWEGAPYPSPTTCPNCGDTHSLRDKHAALPEKPDRDEEQRHAEDELQRRAEEQAEWLIEGDFGEPWAEGAP